MAYKGYDQRTSNTRSIELFSDLCGNHGSSGQSNRDTLQGSVGRVGGHVGDIR